jgi:hypothetical protein
MPLIKPGSLDRGVAMNMQSRPLKPIVPILALLLSATVAVATQPAEEITWVKVDMPPIDITRGPDAGQGIADLLDNNAIRCGGYRKAFAELILTRTGPQPVDPSARPPPREGPP